MLGCTSFVKHAACWCVRVLSIQHHPISVALYYEDQLEESKKKAKDVRENRIPKFFDYFNNVLKSNGSGYLVGNAVTYADLALFQVVDGIQFAFPNCMKRIEKEGKYAEVFKLKKTIENTPQIAEYLQSEKRQKYSMGVFVSSLLHFAIHERTQLIVLLRSVTTPNLMSSSARKET